MSWQLLTAAGAIGRAGSEIMDKRLAMHDLDTSQKANDAYKLGLEEQNKRKLKRQEAEERLAFLEGIGIYGKGAAILVAMPANQWVKEAENLLKLSSTIPRTVPGRVGQIEQISPTLESPEPADWVAQTQKYFTAGEVPLTYQERMERYGFTGEFIDPADLPDDWRTKLIDDYMGHLPSQGLTQEDEIEIRASLTDRLFGPTVSDPSEAIETAAERLGMSVPEYQATVRGGFERRPVEGVTFARVQTEEERLEAGTVRLNFETALAELGRAQANLAIVREQGRTATDQERTIRELRLNAEGEAVFEDVMIGWDGITVRELGGLLTQKTEEATRVRTNAETLYRLGQMKNIPTSELTVMRQYLSGVAANVFRELYISVGPGGVLYSDKLIPSIVYDIQAGLIAAAQHSYPDQGKNVNQVNAYANSQTPLITMMSAVAHAEQVSVPAMNSKLAASDPQITLATLVERAEDKDAVFFEKLLETTGGLGKALAPQLIEYYSQSSNERVAMDAAYRDLIGTGFADSVLPMGSRLGGLGEEQGNGEEQGDTAGWLGRGPASDAAASAAAAAAPAEGAMDLQSLLINALNEKNEEGDTAFNDPELTRNAQLITLSSRLDHPASPYYIRDPDDLARALAVIDGFSRSNLTTLVSRDELEKALIDNVAFAPATTPTTTTPTTTTPTAPALATTGLGGRPAGADAAADAVADADADAAGEVGEPPKLYPADHSPPGYIDALDKERWGRDSANWDAGGEAPPASTSPWYKLINYRAWKAANEQQDIFEKLFFEAHDTFDTASFQLFGKTVAIVTSMKADENLPPERARTTIRDLFIGPLIKRLRNEGSLERLPAVSMDAQNTLADILYRTYVAESE